MVLGVKAKEAPSEKTVFVHRQSQVKGLKTDKV